MMFFDFEIDPPEKTQNPAPSNEEVKPQMRDHGSGRENSLSPISQIVGTCFGPCWFSSIEDLQPAFDEMHGRESNGEQGWHDSIPGSSVDDGEEKPGIFSDAGTQAARSKVSCGSKLAGPCKAVTDGYAQPLDVLDGKQWVEVPTPGLQHDITIRSGEHQQPVNSPLKTKSPLEIGVDEDVCHHCGCNKAPSEKIVTGISKPTILEIQDVDDIAAHVPKAVMSGIPNFEVTAPARDFIQPVPGSWPNSLEGQHDGGSSGVEDQDQWRDGAGFPSTSRDLGLLRAFRHLFL